MYQSMPGCATFDFSKTNEIASFEVTVTMLEFPQRRFWGASMKDIADFRNISVAHRVTREYSDINMSNEPL